MNQINQESRTSQRQKLFFVVAIIILLLIALAEGIALLRHASHRNSEVAAFSQAKDHLPEREDVIIQETAEDLECIHNQINRLFYEMTRDPVFARENIWTRNTERQRRLLSEIERIFQNARAGRHSEALSLLEKDWQNVATASSVNIEESGTNYVITVSMPGFQKHEINISLRGRILTIEAGMEQQQLTKDSKTLSSGCFQTQMMLPSEAKGESAEASYENGMLKVIVPKNPASNSLARKVEIM